MNNNHILTETDIDNIDVKSQLEQQIQIQETKKLGWIFGNINGMKIKFYEPGELIDSSYVKVILISYALINNRNDDKYCFLLVNFSYSSSL